MREYKYLGLLFDSNGLSTKASLTLAGQANKALFSLLWKAHYLHYPDPDLICHLFDSMILPILVYGSELWGPKVCNAMHRKGSFAILQIPSPCSGKRGS